MKDGLAARESRGRRGRRHRSRRRAVRARAAGRPGDARSNGAAWICCKGRASPAAARAPAACRATRSRATGRSTSSSARVLGVAADGLSQRLPGVRAARAGGDPVRAAQRQLRLRSRGDRRGAGARPGRRRGADPHPLRRRGLALEPAHLRPARAARAVAVPARGPMRPDGARRRRGSAALASGGAGAACATGGPAFPWRAQGAAAGRRARRRGDRQPALRSRSVRRFWSGGSRARRGPAWTTPRITPTS